MPITYPLSLPATPLFRSANFGLTANTTVWPSPLTRHEQVVERVGQAWRAQFTLPPMKQGDDPGEWTAFFTSLSGRFGTFLGYDPLRTTPRGIATGTPLVNGASQTGRDLITDGWTTGQTGIMKKGDYFELESSLYMVLQDANSDGDGNATLTIAPPLRTSSVNNAALTTASPKVTMRLTTDDVGWDQDVASYYGFSFAAMEAL